MSRSVAAIYVVLYGLAYFAGPVSLVWGWVRCSRLRKKTALASALSLTGFGLATASALLALSLAVYSRFHQFGFFDPKFARFCLWGTVLSLGGFVFALAGIWRKDPLRWFAPAAAMGTFAYWIILADADI